MKKILVSFALLIGMVGMSHASRINGGWRPYTLTASSAQIVTGSGYLNSIVLSSGCNAGDFAVAFDTVAISTISGVGFTNFADLQVATMTMTPSILFGSTTSAVTGGAPANNAWSAGQADDDYIEFMNGLFVWKNTWAQGQCGKVTVYYTR